MKDMKLNISLLLLVITVTYILIQNYNFVKINKELTKQVVELRTELANVKKTEKTYEDLYGQMFNRYIELGITCGANE